ncbi:hypothetical protein L7F22_061814 [Adiantum nelumboides]|nr:hypothetical protein [Adiantum nelumboides]
MPDLSGKETSTEGHIQGVSGNPLELEEGLLLTVLAFLPLLNVVKLRSVCKLWNSVLSSGSFRKAWSARHDQSCTSWLAMARKSPAGALLQLASELIAFDVDSGSWISLAALLSRRSWSKEVVEALRGPPFRRNALGLPNIVYGSRMRERYFGLLCVQTRRLAKYFCAGGYGCSLSERPALILAQGDQPSLVPILSYLLTAIADMIVL